MKTGRQTRIGWASALLLAAMWSSSAYGHLQPIPLALWPGPDVDRHTVQCQRAIIFIAARCSMVAWTARNACLAAQLNGQTCDTDASDAAIEDALNAVIPMMDDYCTSDDYNILSFGPNINAYADAQIFCQQLDDAAASAIYGPAMHGGTIGAVDATMQRCIGAVAAAGSAMVRAAFQARQEALDLIAAQPMGPQEKMAIILRSTARITRARTGILQRLAASCSDAEIMSLYHQSPTSLLTLIGTRGDCLAGAATVQNVVVCPVSICGNGMQESNEDCDDGVNNGSDGFCRSDCTLETSQ